LSSSFSGSSGGSSSGSSFSGLGGNSGTTRTGTGGTGRAGTSTTGTTPSKNNPYYIYYGSPLSAGLGQNNTLSPTNSLSGNSSSTSGISNFQLLQALTATQGTIGFGNPLYTQTTTSSSTLGGSQLSTLGGSNVASRFPGISTFGMRRAPSFVTGMAEDFKPSPYSSLVPPPNQLVENLRSAISRSSSLKNPAAIQLFLQDNTVVLQGVVSSDHERRLAEGLVRVTPGVRDVRNDLKVRK